MKYPTVDIAHVTVAFEKQTIFADLSVSMQEKRITAILGKSGSGKSTMLQLINGMVQPEKGAVSLSGKPIDYEAVSVLRLSIGYVVQQTGLFPHLTIEENISLLGKVTKVSPQRIAPRLHHLIDMAQLPVSYLNRFPHQLSVGEQQRAGLCRALFLNPPLLLMDEPFASLDRETKRGIYDYVKAFQQSEPRTIVLVTHDWQEAIELGDDFILLESGVIKAQGTRDQLQSLNQIHPADR